MTSISWTNQPNQQLINLNLRAFSCSTKWHQLKFISIITPKQNRCLLPLGNRLYLLLSFFLSVNNICQNRWIHFYEILEGVRLGKPKVKNRLGQILGVVPIPRILGLFANMRTKYSFFYIFVLYNAAIPTSRCAFLWTSVDRSVCTCRRRWIRWGSSSYHRHYLSSSPQFCSYTSSSSSIHDYTPCYAVLRYAE